MTEPFVSVVLGSYNRRPFLKAALESVRNNGQPFPCEIIVVDGGSNDGSLHYLQRQKDVITIIQHNHGKFRGTKIKRQSWGYFMNLGFKAASGKYILMISDDCLLVPGAIENGTNCFEYSLSHGKKIGAMAFYWRNWPDQQDYRVGFTLGRKIFVNHGLFLRKALEEIDWIDEETYQFYHADGDLCLKLWASGYQVTSCETAFVEHYQHAKSGPISNKKDWQAYLKKWEGVYYHSENLNTGGWITLSYRDCFNTYRNFPTWYINKLKLQKMLRTYINKFRFHINQMKKKFLNLLHVS